MLKQPVLHLEREFAAAKTVAKRLEGDFATRVISCILTAGVIAWSGLFHVALIWVFFVLLNEAIEPGLVRKLLATEAPSSKILFFYTAHMTVGSAIWAGAGVALWVTKDPAVMTLGAVLLLGTLMHVTLIYSASRLLVSSVSAPLILAMAAMAALVLADDGIAVRDKSLVILSVVILLAYLVMLLLTNIETQDEMARLAQDNARHAREDPLTRVSNRRHFVEKIQDLQSKGRNFALAFIDLDRFKPLNDEHGHAVGDEALIAIAHRLKYAEGVDFAARLGGDEFGILLWSDASLAPETVHKKLESAWTAVTCPIQTSTGHVGVGASIGCVLSTDAFDDHSKLMHAADVAMIRAKSDGGGVTFFDPAIDSGMFESAETESAFRNAVRDGDIRAALQPIKCVRTQSIKKYELLARWVRPDGGKALAPNEFIPLAERLGLLNEILWSTLDQALPTIRGTGRTLAINISPSQLLSSEFFANLESVLRRHFIPAEQIELEITEQVAIRNDAETLHRLGAASQSGFSIVLDDFGTGYSSISLLDKLPLSKVKLDHTFVRGAMETQHGQELLSAIIELLNRMNLKCCVEGVESPDVEAFVTACGCAEIQGYLIGRPSVLALEQDQPRQAVPRAAP